MSEIDVDTPFVDMGMDSIVAVEWIRTLNKKYKLALAAPMIYDYPNLHTFASFLLYLYHLDLAQHIIIMPITV